MTDTDALGGALDGPWERGFWFRVPLRVQSKSNFRRTTKRRGSAWNSLASFEVDVQRLAQAFRPDDWDLGDADTPVSGRPAVVSFIFARSLLDVSNLDKSIHDAVQRCVFHTDASVRFSGAQSVRSGTGQRGVVAYAQLAADAPTHDITRAGAELAVATMALLDPAELS